MKIIFKFLFIIIFLSSFYSCKPLNVEKDSDSIKKDSPSYEEDMDSPHDTDQLSPNKDSSNNLSFMVIDKKFNAEERAVIDEMFEKYKTLEFAAQYKEYRNFFGGDSLNELTVFLKKRIKYFVRHSDSDYQKMYGASWKNVGASYAVDWLTAIAYPGSNLTKVEINGKKIKIKKPRQGVMFSGPAFFRSDATALERISIFVHEARHADCPNKPTAKIAKLLGWYPDKLNVSEWSCTNQHATCNSSDSARACDKIPWGSYAAGNLFFIKIYKDCISCSEEDKQLANLAAKNYRTRFLTEPFSGTPDTSSFDENN